MKRVLSIFLLLCSFSTLSAQSAGYANPVVGRSLPDPTVIRAADGAFYLYATEDIRNTPIYRSTDLLNWTFMGTAFTNSTRPSFEPDGGIWAPDINYINGQYVLYYSMSVWGGEQTCGIGVATSPRPDGQFIDRGKLFRSNEIGVQNSIDPFYIEDNGRKYLFWGSFRGIYCVELSDDGLALKNPGNLQPLRIAGTAFEGTYIYKRNGAYYLFASVGSCCEGLNSTYRLVVGRSESLTGLYLSKSGGEMLANDYYSVINSNTRFKGNGHCSEIVQDDAGNDWMFIHGWDAENETNGRVLLLNQIKWDRSGWPYVENASPATTASKPVFGTASADEATVAPFQLQAKENVLAFESTQPADVKIYTSCGQLVKSFMQSSQFQATLASGAYIVQINTAIHSIAKTILM